MTRRGIWFVVSVVVLAVLAVIWIRRRMDPPPPPPDPGGRTESVAAGADETRAAVRLNTGVTLYVQFQPRDRPTPWTVRWVTEADGREVARLSGTEPGVQRVQFTEEEPVRVEFEAEDAVGEITLNAGAGSMDVEAWSLGVLFTRSGHDSTE